MKRILVLVLVFVVALGSLFANGTEEQLVFEQILRKQQNQTTTTTTKTNSAVTKQYTNTSSAMSSQIISRDMDSLERLYQYVNKYYLFDIDYDAVYEAMATALFDALDDKYTYYITADQSEEYSEEISGEYGGLGIYFSKTYTEYQDADDESTLYCNITQVFPNTPSAKAGLKAGDMITHINGESVVSMSANECASKMKGEVGTTVEITIQRKTSTFTLTLTRAKVIVPTVEYSMLDNGVAYLRITEFSQNTLSAVEEALDSLEKDGMTSLIIDLRDNPGGDVDVTLSIADLFISGSELLSVSYKDSSQNVTYVASEGTEVDEDVKIAILINGGTASSAEILSSTMRDNGRAKLFGTTSYGKGIMQQISSFGDGYTSVTIASFVPPSGNAIHEVGVEPDVVVEAVTVEDEELEAYTTLVNGTEISDFVKENPDFTDENVSKFVSQFKDTGLRTEVLQILVRNEYYSQMEAEDRPIADVKYDNVCKAAYEYLIGSSK